MAAKSWPKVSLIKPEEIKIAPSWHRETLSEQQVPKEILHYFKKHLTEERVAHEEKGDSYVYNRPWEETEKGQEYVTENKKHLQTLLEKEEDQEKRRNIQNQIDNLENSAGKRWSKHFNLAPELRKELTETPEVKQYFSSLEQLSQQIVPTSKIIPLWKSYLFFQEEVYAFPDKERRATFMLKLENREENSGDARICDLIIKGNGPNVGRAGGPTIVTLLKIGSLEYQGKLLKHN